MASTNYELIRDAISEKHQIIATYRGLRRELCPHTLGHTDGQERALFVQFGGESSRGLPEEGAWCCMDVTLLEGLEVLDGEWFTLDDHSRRQRCVQVVDVEVAH